MIVAKLKGVLRATWPARSAVKSRHTDRSVTVTQLLYTLRPTVVHPTPGQPQLGASTDEHSCPREWS